MKHVVMLVGLLVALGPLTRAAGVSGRQLYAANCAGCHGARAQGGVGPALHEAGGWSAALFQQSILKNVDDMGKPLKAPMPNWGKVGFVGHAGKAPTAAEIKALQASLKTVKSISRGLGQHPGKGAVWDRRLAWRILAAPQFPTASSVRTPRQIMPPPAFRQGVRVGRASSLAPRSSGNSTSRTSM